MMTPLEDPAPGEAGSDPATDDKLELDDPSLGVTPPRKLRKGALVLFGLGALALVGAGIVIARRPPNASAITEEPALVPSVPRGGGALPAFLDKPPPPPPPDPLAVADAEPLRREPAPAAFEPERSTYRSSIERPPDRERQRELELEEEARTAGISFKTAAPAPAGVGGRDDRDGPPPPFPGAMPAPSPSGAPSGFDPNLQDHKSAFLRDRRNMPDYLSSSLQRPISRFELKVRSVIPATLITGLNSDLPGPITAQVRERVFDTVTGDHLLIPQGATLFGWYDSKVAWGQERVLMCWDRIVFPNGNSINLDCMPAADLQGQAGLTDEVDNHWDRLAAAVGLSTILSVGTQAVAGDPSGYQPNLAQRAAANAAGQFNAAGQAFVGRELNLQPTITVRPGYPINLIVTKDIVLEPYVEGP
jgi:type IV secretion system protein TrbI